MSSRPLQRIIGAPTALLIGMGVAIGSGVFRSPGLVARELHDPGLILLAWALGGVIVLMQGMVTAELATRFPRAGGEYVFLREAYGEFVAFFFGWAYTIFIIGGGAAAIALAFGEFSCQWLSLSPDTWAGPTAAVAVVAVVAVNAAGLKVGAGFQNALTCVKALALLAIIVLGVLSNAESMDAGGQAATGAPAQSGASLFALFTAAITWALWPYEGTTDAVKMAEEVKDVRRALPRAVIGSALAVTVLYVLFNFALLRMLPAEEMARLEQAGEPFVPGVALARLGGSAGRSALLAVAIITCLGALSSTLLATIRVTFAMARDGLAFRSLARMSSAQAPVPALVIVGAFAVFLVFSRSFEAVLQIYFLAAAVLFGLSYASLILFRRREESFPANVYRCPAGPVQAAALILIQGAIAFNICRTNPRDAGYTIILLVVVGGLYLLWKSTRRG